MEVTAGEAIAATGIDVTRGGREILLGVDLCAEPAEVTALVGPSGSGKSTLLAVLAGLEPADRGSVRLGEREVTTHDASLRTSYGLILQGYGLVSLLTAAENVEIVLQATGWSGADAQARAAELLERLGLGEVADHLVEQMSGGQQQRVAVARALAPRPPVVLADEPTAELDAETRGVVLDELTRAAAAGAVVVIATHDDEVRRWADREVALHDGRVVGDTRLA